MLMKKKGLLFTCLLLILLVLFVIISGCNNESSSQTAGSINNGSDINYKMNDEDINENGIEENNIDEDTNEENRIEKNRIEKDRIEEVTIEENQMEEDHIVEGNNANESKITNTDVNREEKGEEIFKMENTETEIKSEQGIAEDETDLFIEIYYQDIEGLIIPVTRRIPKQLSVAKSAIYGLIDSPMNRESMAYYGLIPILPKGTEFTIDIKDKTAIIDFNKKILEYNNEKTEKNIVSAVIYTLTQFDSIERVKILINGYEIDKMKFGTDISKELTRDDILINAEGKNGVYPRDGMKKLDIYLLKNVKGIKTPGNNGFIEMNGEKLDYDRIFLVPISVEFSNNEDLKTDEKVDMIMKLLATYKGSNDEKLFSALNESIDVNNILIKGDLLTIDLSIDLGNYGGSFNEYYMVNQILYSMKQFKELKKINILVDGSATSLPEGADFSHPVLFPSTIGNYIDEEGYY
ncbi:MAG TPA: hypothetical protein GXX37_08155 [Clostridiaceae bacterium]|nr:hypothetical protein [Clostridiaceae bacterium]